MATKSAIAKMKLEAINRIAQSMETIGADLTVPALDLATIRHRDPAYQEAKRLEALADWSEEVQVAIVGIQPEVTGDPAAAQRLDSLYRILADDLPYRTKAEMVAFAERYGADVDESLRKDELAEQIAAQLTGKGS